MKQTIDIIDVTPATIDTAGFFCYMSKRKSPGYARKLQWVKERFGEGLKLKILGEGARGFIEYIPGEYAWRAVEAKGFMFIHCLWVVGQSKGQGYAARLLAACIRDAQRAGMAGVAMVTSEGNWLVSKKIFLAHGFEPVATAPPSFTLLVRKFHDAAPPSFVKDISRRTEQYTRGLTVFRSDQCPYLDDAANAVHASAEELNVRFKVIDLKTAHDVRTLAPSIYGVFSIVYNGILLSHHYLLKKDILTLIKQLDHR